MAQTTSDRAGFRTGHAALALACMWVLAGQAEAVTSKVHRHDTSAALMGGDANGVVIGSRGTIRLGRDAEVLSKDLPDVWSINSVALDGGTVYFGTSPNGGIYRWSSGKTTRLHPAESGPEVNAPAVVEGADPNQGPPRRQVRNEHVFSLGFDVAGRLLAGISGSDCRVCRFSASGDMEVLTRLSGDKYIFAMDLDQAGCVYVATGPEGKVYRLDSKGKTCTLVYDSKDRNILSLAVGPDGFVYAGSDSRGLIYKINPRDQSAVVVYDSSLPEIPSLVLTRSSGTERGDLFALGSSAEIPPTEMEILPLSPPPGRPEAPRPKKADSTSDSPGLQRLEAANTKREPPKPQREPVRSPRKGSGADTSSVVYRVDKDGYVHEVAAENEVFFCVTETSEGQLLVGTGNNGRLLSVDPVGEQRSVVYEDRHASQVTAVASADDEVVLGTSNPAKLIRLGKRYALEGTYASDLVDAGQPAQWGKIQVEADLPAGCEVWAACRSGNVEDVNDPTFGQWTRAARMTGPVSLTCPAGRFCQYKLILKSVDGLQTPMIREVVLASTVPNLAPVVESVDVTRSSSPAKSGVLKIAYKAKDGNDDKLNYEIDFRKVGRAGWIKVKDKVEEEDFEWDSRTVEDGRYEIRVVAGDERSNSPATALTGRRISEPVVVDNTGPVLRGEYFEKRGGKTTFVLLVADLLSAIGQLEYTLDGSSDWKVALPDDLVCDTTDESFTIQIGDLAAGEHVISIKVSDDLGNTRYQSFDIPAEPSDKPSS